MTLTTILTSKTIKTTLFGKTRFFSILFSCFANDLIACRDYAAVPELDRYEGAGLDDDD